MNIAIALTMTILALCYFHAFMSTADLHVETGKTVFLLSLTIWVMSLAIYQWVTSV